MEMEKMRPKLIFNEEISCRVEGNIMFNAMLKLLAVNLCTARGLENFSIIPSASSSFSFDYFLFFSISLKLQFVDVK
jgi:hypothetical protein